MPTYPSWLREALYARAIGENIVPAQGAYPRPAIRPAPFYTPYGVQFVWDLPYSAYAVAKVKGDVELAQGFVENMLEFVVEQGPDRGMILRSVTFGGDQAEQDGTQTPLLAWLTVELHALTADDGFLARVYPGLADFVDWWQSPRRDYDRDGLSEFAGSTPTFVAYESGHDFSPERDLVMGEPTTPSDDGLVHEPFADVFLNSCLHVELAALARIAAVVDPAREAEWAQRRDALAARMQEAMWDEDVGGFFPVIRRDLAHAQPRVYRHTPALLQPLWAGIATEQQAARTVDLLLQRPRDYPYSDGSMRVLLGDEHYQGYQVVTDALHPSRGTGSAAGGVELTSDGVRLRFGPDRGPAAAAFTRLEVVVQGRDGAAVQVVVHDGTGEQHVPISGPLHGGRASGHLGVDPFEGSGGPAWTPGLRVIDVRAGRDQISELTVHYSRMDRAGLLSAYGIKSAHPLDGKHPAPGAPTQFWSGTVWGPHQLHGCQALARYGYTDLARAVAKAYCDTIGTSFAASGDAFEHHSHEDGRGLGTAPYTWGAAVALVLMQELLDPVDGSVS